MYYPHEISDFQVGSLGGFLTICFIKKVTKPPGSNLGLRDCLRLFVYVYICLCLRLHSTQTRLDKHDWKTRLGNNDKY